MLTMCTASMWQHPKKHSVEFFTHTPAWAYAGAPGRGPWAYGCVDDTCSWALSERRQLHILPHLRSTLQSVMPKYYVAPHFVVYKLLTKFVAKIWLERRVVGGGATQRDL